MADTAYTEVLDPTGELVWRGDPKDRREALKTLVAAPPTGLAALCTADDLANCARSDVMDSAERLRFVSRERPHRGFLTVLPRATLLDQAVEAFNQLHLESLRANRIDFPLLFSRSHEELCALSDSYEKQGRIFQLAGEDSDLRLAYAADPGLFAWLKGRRLNKHDLPYSIYSPLPVFRRWQSGEVSLDRMRQYPVPDVHILCAAESATEVYEHAVAQAADAARFWVDSDFAQTVDIVDLPGHDPHTLASRLARAAGCHTVVNVLRSRPRYYAVKGGLMIYAGFGLVMLYNFQLDDTNGRRFRFRLDDGGPVSVIHATVAAGWPKILPLVLGRGLAGIGPRAIPAELAWEQVVCVPVADRHVAAAEQTAAQLRDMKLRTVADTNTAGPLGARLRRLRESWQPLHVVLGDREHDADPVIEARDGKDSLPLDEFVRTYEDRFRRCSPSVMLHYADPPFAP